MRVIAKSTLKKFWEQAAYADAQNALGSWYEEASKAAWATPHDVKNLYASASVVAGNRVVFNTCCNKYRLVVEMQYRAGIAWITFIGSHKQYEAINVTEVQP